jgi:hypothetical protein
MACTEHDRRHDPQGPRACNPRHRSRVDHQHRGEPGVMGFAPRCALCRSKPRVAYARIGTVASPQRALPASGKGRIDTFPTRIVSLPTRRDAVQVGMVSIRSPRNPKTVRRVAPAERIASIRASSAAIRRRIVPIRVSRAAMAHRFIAVPRSRACHRSGNEERRAEIDTIREGIVARPR